MKSARGDSLPRLAILLLSRHKKYSKRLRTPESTRANPLLQAAVASNDGTHARTRLHAFFRRENALTARELRQKCVDEKGMKLRVHQPALKKKNTLRGRAGAGDSWAQSPL